MPASALINRVGQACNRGAPAGQKGLRQRRCKANVSREPRLPKDSAPLPGTKGGSRLADGTRSGRDDARSQATAPAGEPGDDDTAQPGR